MLTSPVLCTIDGAPENGATARLSIHLPAPPAQVWAHLVEPQSLPTWLAPGTVDPQRASIDFGHSGVVVDSPVTAWSPCERLSYSWGGEGDPPRPLDFALRTSEDGTHLSLGVTCRPNDDVARAVAGWACHLEMLAAALVGVPIAFPTTQFKALRAAYAASSSTA